MPKVLRRERSGHEDLQEEGGGSMSNPSKKKGTHAEVAAMKWLREHGFPWCDRQPLRGNRDTGDLQLCIDVIAEVKNVAAGATGQPPQGLLATWLMQTDVETENAGAEFGLLIVKRARMANPAHWFVYMRLGEWLRLTGAHLPLPDPSQPVCMSLASAAAVLRSAGYGTAPEGETL